MAKSVSEIKNVFHEFWLSSDKESAFSKIKPNELVTIKDFNGEEQVSLVEVMLRSNNLVQDAVFFDIAKELLKKGAPLPEQNHTRQEFASESEYLNHLANNAHDLFIALYTDPEIINKKGEEDGKTILHHSAAIGLNMGSNSALLIHHQLLGSPTVKFDIQDKDGNTPVHIAAQNCHDRVTCDYIFPNFVEEAVSHKFDFSVLNNGGQAVIHYAIRNSYTDPVHGRRNTVAKLLEKAPKIDVNVVSSTGSTPLFYAINSLNLDGAASLLAAGADPSVFGKEDRDPRQEIQKLLKTLTNYVALVNAQKAGTLNEYLQVNREFFTQLYLESNPNEPDNDELQSFVEDLSTSLDDNLKSIQSQINTIRDMKVGMQAEPKERISTFSFWKKHVAENERADKSESIKSNQAGLK